MSRSLMSLTTIAVLLMAMALDKANAVRQSIPHFAGATWANAILAAVVTSMVSAT